MTTTLPAGPRSRPRHAPPPQAVAPPSTSRGARPLRWLRRHWVFAVLVGLGVGLRAIAMMAYHPALLWADSTDYLPRAADLSPGAWHPLGYPLFLRLFLELHSVTALIAAQHALVVVDAAVLYALLCRFGLRPWLAALAAAPVLLDAFQLDLEGYVLSEALFETLIVAGFAVLLWRRVPAWWQCALVGLLLAGAALVRFDGSVLFVPALAFLVVRRAGLVRVATLLLAVALPLVAYAGWYDSVNGQFTISGNSGLVLYGRVATFADCRGLSLPPDERALCPDVAPARRQSPNWYISSPQSPARTLVTHHGRPPTAILTSFDVTILLHQPLEYLGHVADDFLRQFLPTHQDPVGDSEPVTYFTAGYPTVTTTLVADPGTWLHRYFGGPAPGADLSLDRFLVGYQRVGYTWGPLLAAWLVAGLLALLGVGGARRSGRRAECLALTGGGVLVVLFAVGTALFQFRYVLPSLFLVPPGGMLALAMMVPRLRSERWPDRVDRPAPVPAAALPAGMPPGPPAPPRRTRRGAPAHRAGGRRRPSRGGDGAP